MEKRLRLGEVSLRQLNRDPGVVFERVRRGERLIVRRHKRPLATIQPLDGSPLGDVNEEADKLTDIERSLLVEAVGMTTKIYPVRVSFDLNDAVTALREMELRGLVRRSRIGWVLRGRGMMLREVLLARAGLREEDTWRIRDL